MVRTFCTVFTSPALMCLTQPRTTSIRMAGTAAAGMQSLLQRIDNSLKRDLTGDSDSKYPNQETREVIGSQWVEVGPQPLPDPYLVSVSPAMASTLGIDPEDDPCAFVRYFSGDIGILADVQRPWSTPYAVSVFGQAIPSPDPFGRGNAYGDGRAVSLGEFVADGQRWELQLKGSGCTPFSRGGDGRAVLRSSVREYLVSEAMEAMGVPSTRALCLVASRTQYTQRMWYADGDVGRRDHPPDTLVEERCAITCRAAPSFIRVGHIELWSRRTARGEPGAEVQLRALLEHAMRREFAHIDPTAPLRDRLLELLRSFAGRMAQLSTAWVRVGYVQGNMNSDNCLLSGRTMDYGPFGFVEAYEPLWSPFTSDMERKFGFERQPLAAQVNVMTLARALLPMLSALDGEPSAAAAELQAIVNDEYPALLSSCMGEMRRAKLGLRAWDDATRDGLWRKLQELMTESAVDYTIFWRQLACVPSADAAALQAGEAGALERLATVLAPAFDGGAAAAGRDGWPAWLGEYAARLHAEGRPEAERQAEMRAVSPKYVPREWMLAEAYTAAEQGDHAPLEELRRLFAAPFDEHPEMAERFYRRTPLDLRGKGGIAFFS